MLDDDVIANNSIGGSDNIKEQADGQKNDQQQEMGAEGAESQLVKGNDSNAVEQQASGAAEEESVAMKNPYASKGKKAKADKKSKATEGDADEKTTSGEAAGTEEDEEKKDSSTTEADGEEEKKADEAEGDEKKPATSKLGFFGRMKVNMPTIKWKKKPVDKKNIDDAELEDVIASLDEHEAIELKKAA